MEKYVVLFQLRIPADKERSAPGAESKEASPTIPGPQLRPRLPALSWKICLCEPCSDSSSHASISLIQPVVMPAFSMLYSFSFRHWSFLLSLSLLQTQSLLLICSSLTSQNLALCWVYELSMWTDQINKGSTLTGRIGRSSQSQENGLTYNKHRFWNFLLIRAVFFPVDLVGLLNSTSWNMLTDFENALKIKPRD